MFVICVKAIIYLPLYHARDCTFKEVNFNFFRDKVNKTISLSQQIKGKVNISISLDIKLDNSSTIETFLIDALIHH